MKKLSLSNSNDVVLVDNEDYPVLSRLNWYLSDMGYAITDAPVKHLKMHKLLIPVLPTKTVIDHIDRNKLNNQKSNLRVVSQKENMLNTSRIDNAKYYYYDFRRKKWIVDSKSLGARSIQVDNPTIADRVVKRLKLGFPKELAIREAYAPTISITNWKVFDIDYHLYSKAKENGMTVKNYRRKQLRESTK